MNSNSTELNSKAGNGDAASAVACLLIPDRCLHVRGSD